MTYVVLLVESAAEAVRLVEDIREHPFEDLRTPHWANRVRAVVAGIFDQAPTGPLAAAS